MALVDTYPMVPGDRVMCLLPRKEGTGTAPRYVHIATFRYTVDGVVMGTNRYTVRVTAPASDDVKAIDTVVQFRPLGRSDGAMAFTVDQRHVSDLLLSKMLNPDSPFL